MDGAFQKHAPKTKPASLKFLKQFAKNKTAPKRLPKSSLPSTYHLFLGALLVVSFRAGFRMEKKSSASPNPVRHQSLCNGEPGLEKYWRYMDLQLS